MTKLFYPMKLLRDGPLSFAVTFPALHLLLRALLRLIAPRWRVTGRNHIPRRGAVLYAPNHISDADPALVGAAVRHRLHYVAKRELWEYPWLAPVMTYMQAFPIDPDSADRKALRLSANILKKQEGLVIFPEGKIASDGQLGPLLPGVVMLALQSGAAVVPVGIAHADKLIRYGEMVPRFTTAKIRLHFGEPLHFTDLAGLPGHEARAQALERLETGIKAAVARAYGSS
jgi:1-acyl-sn-glycerol-3-phosphate acyltransferase